MQHIIIILYNVTIIIYDIQILYPKILSEKSVIEIYFLNHEPTWNMT